LSRPKTSPFVICFLALVVPIIIASCVRMQDYTPSVPLTREQVHQILSTLIVQSEQAESFISSGRLKVKVDESEFNANILLAGTKSPFRIKMEVTHRWGRPLFHILIYGTKIQIVSYQEKRCYIQQLGSPDISGLFPASLTSDQVWGLARGYPTIAKYNTAILQQTDQILLLTGKGKAIQSVRFLPESRLPSLTIFPNQGIKISFQNYNKIAGVYYAKSIGIDYPKAAITWSLDIRQASFNGYIPEEVFNLEIPSGFEVVPSSKQTIP